MAKGNLPACLAVTLAYEGGWSDHPKDPGGATMRGVTLAVFRSYKPGATKADLRAISDADVHRIYRDKYWYAVNGEGLPAGVDLATFDFGVNSGPSRAAKYLQGIVGVKADGKIGPATMSKMQGRDPVGVVQGLCGKRLGFVRGLKTFATFGKGWARRIADVEARGVAMAVAKNPGARVVLMKEAEAALSKSVAQNKATNGSALGGAVAAGASSGADLNLWVIGGVLVATVALVMFVKSRATVNKLRAEAYVSAMQGVDAGA